MNIEEKPIQTRQSQTLLLRKATNTNLCGTLENSDDVPTLAPDNRGIFVCGISDSRELSPLLPDAKDGCVSDGGGCKTVYGTPTMTTDHTRL